MPEACIMDDAPARPPPMEEVAVGTPEVKGRSEAEEAPLKTADWVEAVGMGVAIVMLGFRTLGGGRRVLVWMGGGGREGGRGAVYWGERGG